MEYRKKNLKPKKGTDLGMLKAIKSEDFMNKVDFVGSLRKDIFLAQNEHKIKP